MPGEGGVLASLGEREEQRLGAALKWQVGRFEDAFKGRSVSLCEVVILDVGEAQPGVGAGRIDGNAGAQRLHHAFGVARRAQEAGIDDEGVGLVRGSGR